MIEIHLTDDEMLEEMIRRRMDSYVQLHMQTILDHQLKDIVAGHIAKMRLDNPNSKTITEVIDNCLGNLILEKINFLVDARMSTLKMNFKNQLMNALI